MHGHVIAAPFPLSDRASDVRPGCKTQRIAPTLRQVADLMCARIKERVFQNMYCWTRELLPPVCARATPELYFQQNAENLYWEWPAYRATEVSPHPHPLPRLC
ncbi:hypothetical protein PoB_001844700 [Plakobranchus ocellatus]|uniref:Uncharacterized protein n=1 Tax=Plakobranchus ocellatus TaxID=259542 RepID=A0AAV3ZBN0_9GAST|nr:hypothetical protein PoB_001844700 [Plakobranchus ocellatus]